MSDLCVKSCLYCTRSVCLLLLSRKLECGMLASQGCVHSRECFELVGHLVRVVQRHLDQLGAVQGHTNTFAADVGRVHKVCQDGSCTAVRVRDIGRTCPLEALRVSH